MRVSLEILRMILDHFAMDSDGWAHQNRPLLQLRYVNTLFAEEVLFVIFSRTGLVQANKLLYADLPYTPPSLREKFLYYRTFKHGKDTRLFTYLFNPVFERQLTKLGIQTFDHAARHEKLTEWCKYFMHEHWKLSWVVTQCQTEYVRDLNDYCKECQDGDQPDSRIENDRKFLAICCAIVENDKDAVLQEFEGFYSGVDDLNYCFGTTLLGFALKWGTPEMLQLLLRSIRSTSYANVYIYLELATSRKENDGIILVKALLDRFSGFDTAKKTFTINLLSKFVSVQDKIKFNAVISWFAAANGFPNKLGVLEWYCKHLTPLCPSCDLLSYSSPTPRTATFVETFHSVPTYQLGIAYEAYLKILFYARHSGVNWYPSRGINVAYTPALKSITPPTALFLAAQKGKLYWIDWLLWAGADARHVEGEVSLLDFAWKRGNRRQVGALLYDHGWDVKNLMLKIG